MHARPPPARGAEAPPPGHRRPPGPKLQECVGQTVGFGSASSATLRNQASWLAAAVRLQLRGPRRRPAGRGPAGRALVHGRVHDGQPHVIHVWHHKDFLQRDREGQRERQALADACKAAVGASRRSDASYLELLLQFPLYPVGHMGQSDLPLPQLWPCLQLQVRRRPEAVPATAMTRVRLRHERQHSRL